MSFASLFDDARGALAGVPREPLGELRTPRRVLGMPRATRIVRVGSAWHLGVLLLGDDVVYATGQIVRARQEAPRGYTAESQRARADLAAAARRGGFAEGEALHIGWRMLDLEAVAAGAASGPLAQIEGIPSVRWSAAAAHVPLDAYLRERVALLRDPPQGA
ncbi:glutaminase [Microbacterium deminutum]|uniref:Glutaminase n=1 Tax=Microbacterium deminutum TaxID=344164 RepID=A0ABN2Q643_9MICO